MLNTKLLMKCEWVEGSCAKDDDGKQVVWIFYRLAAPVFVFVFLFFFSLLHLVSFLSANTTCMHCFNWKLLEVDSTPDQLS